MADVNRGRKGAAKTGGAQSADSVRQQGRTSRITITGRFSALQVLERADHGKQPHWENHRQKFPTDARPDTGEQVSKNGREEIEMKVNVLRGWLEIIAASPVQRPGDNGTNENSR